MVLGRGVARMFSTLLHVTRLVTSNAVDKVYEQRQAANLCGVPPSVWCAMFAVFLNFLMTLLRETLRVAGKTVLKAMAAAAIAAVVKGLAEGFRSGLDKARSERA
ncbi:MAG: putative nicotinamide N-methyase [Bradymonadia bacterium]|jgi:predicted nicotinamide N-methyase